MHGFRHTLVRNVPSYVTLPCSRNGERMQPVLVRLTGQGWSCFLRVL